MRAGPGTEHPIVAVAPRGDRLMILGRDGPGSWLQVRLADGRAAWVAASVVQTAGDIRLFPTVAAPPTPPAAPTLPPSSPVAKQATANVGDLEVTFVNPHYECELQQFVGEVRVWGYRSFQADLFIRNNSQQPINPPWRPKSWTITNGTNDRSSELVWEWVSARTGAFQQPIIHPGQVAGWTFVAFPIERDEWVKGVTFEWNSQPYEQTFDLGPLGNAHNYRDCGDYPPNAWPREPLPPDVPAPGGQTAPPPPSR